MESFPIEDVYGNLPTEEYYVQENFPSETGGELRPDSGYDESFRLENGLENLRPVILPTSTGNNYENFFYSNGFENIAQYGGNSYENEFRPESYSETTFRSEINHCDTLRPESGFESLRPESGYDALYTESGGSTSAAINYENLVHSDGYDNFTYHGNYPTSYGVPAFHFNPEFRQPVDNPYFSAQNYYLPWNYPPPPYAPEPFQRPFPYNPPVLPNFLNNVTFFPTLPTTLSYEINDQSTLIIPSSETVTSNFNVDDKEKSNPKPKSATVADGGAQKMLVSTSSLGGCDEKIRFRNRDYYGMPVTVNVSKGDNNADQGVLYNLTTKQSKSSRQRGAAKRITNRNPFSTKFTVKNLKKLLEMQHKILTPVKDGDKVYSMLTENVANGTEEVAGGSDGNQNYATVLKQFCPDGYNGAVVSSDCGILSMKSPPDRRSSKLFVDKRKLFSPDIKPVPLRNRSYEFDSLQIGSFIVQSTQENVSRNKLRFYFSQKQMVYDFEYSYQVDGVPVSVLLLVMVHVSLDSIVAASFRSREVEFILNKAPQIVSGFDRKKIPALLKTRNFGQTTIDVTRGALNSVLVHKICLPRAQGELIQKHLVQYNPSLNNT